MQLKESLDLKISWVSWFMIYQPATELNFFIRIKNCVNMQTFIDVAFILHLKINS